jgi:hypothetical protein
MKNSTFRIVLVVLCAIFVVLYAVTHFKLRIQSDENLSGVSTKDVDAEEVKEPKALLGPSTDMLPQANPIGFDYPGKDENNA